MQHAPTGSQPSTAKHCKSVYSIMQERSLPHDAFVNMEFTFMPRGTGRQRTSQDEFTLNEILLANTKLRAKTCTLQVAQVFAEQCLHQVMKCASHSKRNSTSKASFLDRLYIKSGP